MSRALLNIPMEWTVADIASEGDEAPWQNQVR
ncbi:MAG: hypothetical protein ETSY2_51410 [Candidatus Entotheonella gemina]|uniref:Uncharacterized protein n=1 Tax=Candidatus Entotheonella gemina TaxID=1429439 RepID=W4L6Y2_9BACT|nr:MAG: hypothetical protein ETSY2_51410 [Candidatus Entotheonella gemina]